MSEEWRSKFIALLSSGVKRQAAIERLNLHPKTLEDALAADRAFAGIVSGIENGIGSGVLCVAELSRLREAQVSEKRAAGYFGMTLEDFRKALDDNPELKHVFYTAELKGQAQIQVWQYESAADNPDMQKHLGKHYVDQKDSTEIKIINEELTDPKEIMNWVHFINAEINAKIKKGQPVISDNVIDIKPETEVKDALAISDGKSDNDLGPA